MPKFHSDPDPSSAAPKAMPMRKRTVLTKGQVFGFRTVEGPAPTRDGETYWFTICVCGKRQQIPGAALVSVKTRSCGCQNGGSRTHGMTHTKTHRAWCAMRRRCEKPKDPYYSRYGGRGIKVCERWQKFDNFYADMGTAPDGLSLDRINNDGNYEPSNCRWATNKQQGENKSGVRWITFQGQTRTLTGWAKALGVTHSCLMYREARGLSIEKILAPAKKRRSAAKKGAGNA